MSFSELLLSDIAIPPSVARPAPVNRVLDAVQKVTLLEWLR
jgi:hypothetical protein